ncbi:MAG: N-acetylmuramoyl-L-alanine amidase [Candidatus Paracaedibacteraceae bacterium]|nr:N-acetylmuramoyl-L-alanine amidase [Candidatus Paracaedibacteraceae bacterium]
MTYDCIKIPSLNFSSREGCPIKALVVHCIGLPLIDVITGLTQSIQNGGLGVSSHYFIPQISGRNFATEIGTHYNLMYPDKIPVIQFVHEKDKAWHAGQSWWQELNTLPGCENTLNPCSIGIEFHAPGYDDTTIPHTFAPYTQDQMATGAALINDIINRHQIPLHNIVGHSDIAPIRPDGTFKTDPGPLFPWDWLRKQL